MLTIEMGVIHMMTVVIKDFKIVYHNCTYNSHHIVVLKQIESFCKLNLIIFK